MLKMIESKEIYEARHTIMVPEIGRILEVESAKTEGRFVRVGCRSIAIPAVALDQFLHWISVYGWKWKERWN